MSTITLHTVYRLRRRRRSSYYYESAKRGSDEMKTEESRGVVEGSEWCAWLVLVGVYLALVRD